MIKKNSKEKLFETMARLDKTFKPKLNEVLVGSESSSPLLMNSPVIKNPLDKAGLVDGISAFDIAEAIAVYVYNYNEDIPTIHELRSILTKLSFKPSPMFSYNENDLEEDGKLVYNALVNYYENNNNEPVQETTNQLIPEASKYQINPRYTHFAAMKDGSGIINGWDYNGIEPSELSLEKKYYFFNDIAEIDVDPKLVAVYTRKKLEKMGINPFDKTKWKNTGTKDLDETPTDVTNYPEDPSNSPSSEQYSITIPVNDERFSKFLSTVPGIKDTTPIGNNETKIFSGPLNVMTKAMKQWDNEYDEYNYEVGNDVSEGNGQVAFDMQNQGFNDGHYAKGNDGVFINKFKSFYDSLTPEEKKEFTQLRIGPIQKQEPEMGGGADGIVDYDR